ncbi:LysR family transcriptional regulator [Saccharibacillus alkalitolerans]|uniref:LysR family transcriptional regulator n=1 Tax=Saccharibacillus alkalitolerans TaxID=2705290 RepID=A0ABX0F193_9BACL|nr:LysR family transcriptional regulator [Saccharibacillus alkalitolerans]NGZ74285.1 LysR family transcriptional regulator [Saccharibacillus alkalitolerans]
MDLKELLAFREVIEQGTFAKAAEKLHYAQSTVTAQIQRLEKELGFRLFERGWEAKLTEAGRLYAAEVDGLIRHWTHVRNRGLALGGEESGLLAFGVIEPVADRGLTELLAEFRRQKPGIECRVTVDSSEGLARSLNAGEIELAICGQPRTLGGAYFEPLYTEEIVFAVDRAHPLAGGERLTLEDFYRYPLVAGGENCLYHLRLEQEFSAYPAKPFAYTISRLSSVPGAARALRGIAAVLASTPLPDGMAHIPYALEDPKIAVGLLQSGNGRYRSPGADILAERIRSAHKISASDRPHDLLKRV